MIQRATKHTPISASIEFINEQGTRDPTCRISQRLAVFVFLIFLSMGRGVFCNLLLFIISSVPCIKF